MSNTVAVFPKAWYRLSNGFELYGGPLIAWANVPLADPRNSRFNGGHPQNVLQGDSKERFLGVELDLGARVHLNLYGSEWTLGTEWGILLPGPAFNNRKDEPMDSISGGRLILRVNL